MKSKLSYILIPVILIAGALYAAWYMNQSAPTVGKTGFERVTVSRISSESEPSITFLTADGEKSLEYVYSIPLPNGKTFYLGIPVKIPADEYDNAGMNCGTGGCQYHSYIGDTYVLDKPTRLTPVTISDSYSIDCDTGKAIFYSDRGETFLGSPMVDKVNRIVRMYYHLTASLGSENIYHIADNGTPKLIASYSNECDDSWQQATSTNMLYRDSSYPNNLTAF